MPTVRNHQLIKETLTFHRCVPPQPIDEATTIFIVKRYFHYGLLAMMNGEIFASQLRFAIKMRYILYSQIPKKFKKMFTYSSKLFGYTFLPVLENMPAERYGYVLKPAPDLLKKIVEYTDNDQIYKLIKK